MSTLSIIPGGQDVTVPSSVEVAGDCCRPRDTSVHPSLPNVEETLLSHMLHTGMRAAAGSARPVQDALSTADQAAILDNITTAMKQCAAILNELPQSRERALAMTKLEECSFWSKKCAVFRT